MPFTLQIRISDMLMTRLKNRTTLKESVAYVMDYRMNEAVAMARVGCPVRTGYLQSLIRIYEWDPDEPMIKGGVIMEERGARFSILDMAFRRGFKRGFPFDMRVSFKDVYDLQPSLKGRSIGTFDIITNEIEVATRGRSNESIEQTLRHELWHAIQKKHGVGFDEWETYKVARRAMGAFRPYPAFVEFGTSKMAARPFWRPAVWAAFYRMLEDFKRINSGEVSYA